MSLNDGMVMVAQPTLVISVHVNFVILRGVPPYRVPPACIERQMNRVTVTQEEILTEQVTIRLVLDE